MKRIKLVVAYDGTDYSGWQVQPNAPTIEGELNRHLSELLQEDIEVIGASRTDAGVHAFCNIAVFDTNAGIPAEKISYAMNRRLPAAIRIQSSEETEPDFHPRHTDSIKTYVYRIYNAAFPMPVMRLYTHFTYVPLDEERMRAAAACLVGTHDFKSFCSIRTQAEATIRTITDIQVQREEAVITISVSGTGFLYNMVRIIAGTLMEAGSGRILPEQVSAILEAKDREAAGPTAPANGLTLQAYEFLDKRPKKA